MARLGYDEALSLTSEEGVEFHFLDVGIGNTTLMVTPGGTVTMYDCNITEDNESEVMTYVGSVIGRRAPIVA